MNTVDTIAAPATGTGGAIAIIRIAGERALAVGNTVWHGRRALDAACARQMLYGKIGDPGEPALAVYMPKPHSYTGDDVVELHCHGGAVAARRTLDAVLAAPGVRAADPGEFTMRAFVNGKLDLAQAEAVGDLVRAQSDSAFNLAARQLAGALSKPIGRWRETLLALASDCESRLDFPDEQLDWDPPETLAAQVEAVRTGIVGLRDSGHAGAVLRDGVRLVLAGRPNAGKSSLLNRLLGIDRAIVSAIPGTTRDTLEENAVLRQVPVRLTDTAGLRASCDEIEALGVERAHAALATAQVVFWLLDASVPDPAAELAEFYENAPRGGGVIAVWNKIDLVRNRKLPMPDAVPTVCISAATGENMAALLDEFERSVWGRVHDEEPEVAVGARHLELLNLAAEALSRVPAELAHARWELAASGLRGAMTSLGKIVGETADPDLLEEIFARFCIGK